MLFRFCFVYSLELRMVTNSFRYVDDTTSPIFIDPLNEEDYTYSILGKPLVKKPSKPVANPARPVIRASGQSDEAQRAQNDIPRQLYRTKPAATHATESCIDTARTDSSEDSKKQNSDSCLDAET